MEERQDTKRDLISGIGVGHPAGQLINIGTEVGMGQHRPLGATGGAAGILEYCQIIDSDIGRRINWLAANNTIIGNMAQIGRDVGQFTAFKQ